MVAQAVVYYSTHRIHGTKLVMTLLHDSEVPIKYEILPRRKYDKSSTVIYSDLPNNKVFTT